MVSGEVGGGGGGSPRVGHELRHGFVWESGDKPIEKDNDGGELIQGRGSVKGAGKKFHTIDREIRPLILGEGNAKEERRKIG